MSKSPSWLNPDGSVDYDEYINSPEWAAKRFQRIRMDDGVCQVCCRAGLRVQVHHMTYRNLGHERMDELITICETCHAIVTQIERGIQEQAWETLSDWQWVQNLARNGLFPHAIGVQVVNIVLRAINDHADGLPDLDKVSQAKMEAYVSNVMEAVRDTRRHEMDQYVQSSALGIAQKIKWGTRQGISSVGENVRKHTAMTQKLLDRLPRRKDFQTNGRPDDA